MSSHTDTIDLADVVRAVRRGRRALFAFLALGVLGALAVVLWAPRRFTSSSSLIIRDTDASSSLLSKIGGSDMGSLLGVGGKSSIATEMSILGSESVADAVIDSLGLQVRVRSPAGVPVNAIISKVALSGSFAPAKYSFDNARGVLKVMGGTLTLRSDTTLPRHLVLEVYDREDAAKRFDKYLSVSKAGGDVVSLQYTADDSLTAARVPNAIAAVYLERRHTTDRGVNEHRVEFLEPRIDTAAAQLAAAENALRRQQEASGILDPQAAGKMGLQTMADLRSQLTAIDVERGAMDSLLAQVHRGAMSPRQIAAYPSFIKSSAITELLSQLSTLDAERLKLLATRTEKDPEVVSLTKSIATIEGEFVPIGTSYAAALSDQRRDIVRALDSLRSASLVLPREAEASSKLQMEVLRLGQVHAALAAQLVEAKLAAISEGGDVHQLDVAYPPRQPSFPNPYTTMGIGIGGGLVIGVIAALFMSAVGRWANDPAEVERIAGVPAMQLAVGAPLLIGHHIKRTVLVLPLDHRANTAAVAEQVAETAIARATTATILDLTAPSPNPNETITRLEQEFGCVVVRLPEITTRTSAAALRDDRVALLVAAPGRVDKAQLNSVLGALRRMDVPCAGVVLSPADRRVAARV